MEQDNAQDAKAIEEPGAQRAEFDAFAENYDSELNRGLRLSGESKEYFAESRMLRLRARLAELGLEPGTALDFGCGTGSATPFFFGILGIQRLLGTDPSESSLAEARRQWGEFPATYCVSTAGWEGSCDLAFCNGVFHHIPVAERDAAFAAVRGTLKPWGVFAFWENNPWNPLTRLAMRRVPFDADAILVWPHEAKRRLRENGFEVLRTDYAFFFPKFLSAFRFLEPWLRWLPLGGQYLVLCRKAP
jgi:SAM-dependent methyltransferase